MEEPSNEVIMYPWPWVIMEVLLMSPDSGSRSGSRGRCTGAEPLLSVRWLPGEWNCTMQHNICFCYCRLPPQQTVGLFRVAGLIRDLVNVVVGIQKCFLPMPIIFNLM